MRLRKEVIFLQQWFRFFFGTPQRFLATAGAMGLVVVIANPGLLRMAVERLLIEVSPLFGPLLQLGVAIVGLRVILSPFLGGGKRK